MTTSENTIAIVGAGVFGLSTALHLAEKGAHFWLISLLRMLKLIIQGIKK